MDIKTGSYTGNGNDARGITGAGFQPDFVMLTNEGNAAGVWTHTSLGANKAFYSTGAAIADCIISLDVDGFSVDNHGAANLNERGYYWLALRDDGTDDIHLTTYTGDGNNNRNLDFNMGDWTPDFALTHGDFAGYYNHWTTSSHGADDSKYLIASGNRTDRIQSLIADGIQVGANAWVNASGKTFYCLCLKEVAGYFYISSYTGNAPTDDRSISGIGFQPDDIWIGGNEKYPVEKNKALDGIDSTTYFKPVAAFANAIQDIEADGFQIGNHADVNANGVSFPFCCWKEGSTGGGEEHEKSLSDTINMTDARIASLGLNKADSISLSDSISKGFGLNKADSIILSDSIIKAFGLNKGDTVNLSDAISSKAFGLNKADTVSLSDSIAKKTSFSKADTINLSDSIVKKPGPNKADTINLSDSISSKSFGLNKADNISLSDSISKSFSFSKADTINMADEISTLIAIIKNLADTITMSDEISSKTFGLNKADVISLSDSVAKEFGLSKADTINMTDEAIKAFGLSLSDNITLSDSLDSAVLGVIAALYNFLAKNKTFNFLAKNKTFNFLAKPRP